MFDSWSNESCKVRNTVMYGYIMTIDYVTLLFFIIILLQLVCLIAEVMDLIRYVLLLCMGTYAIVHKKL